MKLNEGVSGEGNALRRPARPAGARHGRRADAIGERLHEIQLRGCVADARPVPGEARASGGVVEERIAGDDFRSPSVQLRVTPLGEVELLSTHDQLLGGPSGQTFLGCRFPADPEYAPAITRGGGEGRRAARRGGRDRPLRARLRHGADANGAWDPYAIEINLRKGGTTHPFLTLQFLTDGTYDPEPRRLHGADGQEKYFVASDHVEYPAYRA